jgi:hypothetical protein
VETGTSEAEPNPVLQRPISIINLRGMQDTTAAATTMKGNQNRSSPPMVERPTPTTSGIHSKDSLPIIEPLPTPDFMLYDGCNNRWFERGLGQKPEVRPPDLPLGLAAGECIRSWHCAGTVGLCCKLFFVFACRNPTHFLPSNLTRRVGLLVFPLSLLYDRDTAQA